MKRSLAGLLVMLLLFGLPGCRKTEADLPENNVEQETVTMPTGEVQESEQTTPDGPDEPEQTPEEETQAGPAMLALSAQTNRYYGMFDEGMLGYVDYPRIRLDETGRPELAAALDALSAELYQRAYAMGEAMRAQEPGQSLSAARIGQTVRRADEVCLSVVYETFWSDGAQTPEWAYFSYNFDPESGRQLLISDVFDDLEMLRMQLAARLGEEYPGVELAELGRFFSSDESSADDGTDTENTEDALVWALGYEGVEFYFAPGLAASEEAGALCVTLGYDELQTALAARYRSRPVCYAEELAQQSELALGLGQDGQVDTLVLEVPTVLEENRWVVKTIELSINGAWTTIDCPENTVRVRTWLLHTGDGVWLYAQCTDETGGEELMAIALRADGAELVERYAGYALATEEQAGAVWEALLTDPARLRLQLITVPGQPGVQAHYALDAAGRLVAQG